VPEVSDLFKRVDTTKKLYIRTQTPEEAKERTIPHVIRLPSSAAPEYIKLTTFQKFAWRVLGKTVTSRMKPNTALDEGLRKAHMRIRPEEYMACIWMATILAAIGSVIAGIVVGPVLLEILGLPLTAQVAIFGAITVIIPIMVYALMRSTPASNAKKIARDIDKRIASAMSFISAMATADVNVDVIFKELARQPIYGEICKEAEWITRDTELMGVDILTAIRRAISRTPSKKLQDFLQGVITTSTSGGQLKPYFLLKADEYEKEAKLDLKARMETLGLMAESFVVVVVAFPLFLVLILAIMAIIGGSAGSTMMILYMVVLLMIPMSQFGFIFIIWNSEKESAV